MSLDIKTLHVLVVEDIQPMRELTVRTLRALGIERITMSKDGKEGYQTYCKMEPDVILTDWKMPTMSGLDMLIKIRRDQSSPNRTIPIIMMTGFCSKDRIALARDSGVTEFLVKPFSAQDVTRRIASVIKSPRDIIVTPQYLGPDRRRKREDTPPGNQERRQKDPEHRIPGKLTLRKEVAESLLNPTLIQRGQSILDSNRIDFVPLVTHFLDQLSKAVEVAQSKENPGRRDLSNLIDEVMQIKANAKIFKYDLVGDLAGIMLHFLEELNEIDANVVQIIEAHQKTLRHLINHEIKGDGGASGEILKEELTSACNRYMNVKIKRSKEKFLNSGSQ